MNTQQHNEIRVSFQGKAYVLGPKLASLWSSASDMPKLVRTDNERMIRRMAQSGLAVLTEETGRSLAAYRLLSQCILCPNPEVGNSRRTPLMGRNRRIWKWINGAGLRLTACELIRLEEQRLHPTPELLGETHRRALTEAIYTMETKEDCILETAMEHSAARDTTVASLQRLLHNHYLFLA